MACLFSDIESDASDYSDLDQQDGQLIEPSNCNFNHEVVESNSESNAIVIDKHNSTSPVSSALTPDTVPTTKSTSDRPLNAKSELKATTTQQTKKKKKRVDWSKYYTRKTPILVLKCLICTATFNAHCQWRKHMNNVHHIEKPYQCQLCLPKNVCYASKSGLNAHIQRDHEKIRKWKCEHCPKAFWTKEMREQHQRVHDGLKPFECTECEQKFTQRCSLRQHIKTVHRKERNYICSYCQQGFPSSSSMKGHMVAKHNDAHYARFECDICHKRYYMSSGYRKHRESAHRPVDPIKAMLKTGECFYEDCDKKYTSNKRVESLKYHLVHTHGDRRYANHECKKCNRLFYDKTKWRKHMDTKH